MGIFSAEEVLNDADKVFGATCSTVSTANDITVTLAASTNNRHYLGAVVLTATAGTGGAEAISIRKGTSTDWSESFAVGTDKKIEFDPIPLVGNKSEAVSIVASATNLTAGKLCAVYYTKGAWS